jgi:hypothetical protein
LDKPNIAAAKAFCVLDKSKIEFAIAVFTAD